MGLRLSWLTGKRRFSEHPERHVTTRNRGNLAADRATVTAARRDDGRFVVTSNDDTLSAEDIALG